MKKTLLWMIILALAITLVSCAYPNHDLPTTEIYNPPTTSEVLPPETTQGLCGDSFTTTESGVDCPGVPTQTDEPTPTCETGNLTIPEYFIAPADEEKANVTYGTALSTEVKLEVTLYGYKSESLGKELYFKSNEPIAMQITLKNETDAPIYQWQPTMCHDMTPSHDHELSIFLANENGKKLTNMNVEYLYYTGCPQAIEVWSLQSGESYEWNMKYFVGYAKENVIWMDPICDTEFFTTFESYDSDIYTDGICLFEGSVDFAFGYTADGLEYCNTEKLSVPLFLHVFYVKD